MRKKRKDADHHEKDKVCEELNKDEDEKKDDAV